MHRNLRPMLAMGTITAFPEIVCMQDIQILIKQMSDLELDRQQAEYRATQAEVKLLRLQQVSTLSSYYLHILDAKFLAAGIMPCNA